MIDNMTQFRDAMDLLKKESNNLDLIDLVEVLELRIRRLENHLAMQMPDNILIVRAIADRRKEK